MKTHQVVREIVLTGRRIRADRAPYTEENSWYEH